MVIEVDHPYWHKPIADRDARKDALLASRGITTVRIDADDMTGADLTDDMVRYLISKIEVHPSESEPI